MSRKDISHLDAELLAARMKRHRSRSVMPVAARSNMQYLRKHAIADVWLPSDLAPKPKKSVPGATHVTSPSRVAQQSATKGAPIKQAVTLQLDFAKSAAQWKAAKKSKWSIAKSNLLNKPKLTNFALMGMAGVVFMVGIAAALHSFRVDRQITETVSAQAQVNGTATLGVDETAPTNDDIYAYSVAPDMPKLISIPSLDVLSRVRQVGIDQDGALQAPHNIHDVAWYTDSVKPGSPGGASIIDGHVSGPTQKGVFHRLEQLKLGDSVQVERGDGTIISYKVVRVDIQDVHKVDMAKLLLPITVGKHGLNLISCTGKFNAATNNYEQRVMVFAEAV